MRNLWKVGALSAVFGAVLGMGGCQDFDAAYEECRDAGRCDVKDGGDSQDGGGGDGGYDCEPVPNSGPDLPDDEAKDTDCDGVDGVADAGYFVDPERGLDDKNDGSRVKPFQTLARALREIRDGGSGRTIVYLGTGTYNEPAPVVDIPVSIHGGYKWQGGTSPYWGRFLDGGGTTFFDGGALAFTVRDVTGASVVLDSLHIASATIGNDGGASVALKIVNSVDTTLNATRLESGTGGTGASGVTGGEGASGGTGATGQEGKSGSGGNSRSGGANVCAAGGARTGGASGSGLIRGDGQPGFKGAPSDRGGSGGQGGGEGTFICPVPGQPCSCFVSNGHDGGVGQDANDAGAAGRPGLASLGQMDRATGAWTPRETEHGQGGEVGPAGGGGGGGGGGGACSASSLPAVPDESTAGAGSGGGGGAGGCGGQPGTGGLNGGASIALIVIDSRVTLSGMSQVHPGQGGMGGEGMAGGPGGGGGPGGSGGQGATTNFRVNDAGPVYTVYGGTGGNGAKGGAGGPGGAGGGGAGGPSVGVWCLGDAGVALINSQVVTGQGGAGGVSVGGNAGPTGLTQDFVDCIVVDAGTP
ncbi:hypothetical protein [Corallococcus sp. EGB]|uniref:hypothetical protein n=1 Tax=Corallococcus sp. EGB TaxID=1521117 RepID=UPI002714B7BB|nr:hypothetical protein [Corallococcus sp. EGB]